MIKENYWGEEIHFEAVDVTVSVEAIYQRVSNKDVEAFLLAKQETQKPP